MSGYSPASVATQPIQSAMNLYFQKIAEEKGARDIVIGTHMDFCCMEEQVWIGCRRCKQHDKTSVDFAKGPDVVLDKLVPFVISFVEKHAHDAPPAEGPAEGRKFKDV